MFEYKSQNNDKYIIDTYINFNEDFSNDGIKVTQSFTLTNL